MDLTNEISIEKKLEHFDYIYNFWRDMGGTCFPYFATAFSYFPDAALYYNKETFSLLFDLVQHSPYFNQILKPKEILVSRKYDPKYNSRYYYAMKQLIQGISNSNYILFDNVPFIITNFYENSIIEYQFLSGIWNFADDMYRNYHLDFGVLLAIDRTLNIPQTVAPPVEKISRKEIW